MFQVIIELVPDAVRIASQEESFGAWGPETVVHVIRTEAAEMEWFVPTDIEDDAIFALLGLISEADSNADTSEPPAAQDP